MTTSSVPTKVTVVGICPSNPRTRNRDYIRPLGKESRENLYIVVTMILTVPVTVTEHKAGPSSSVVISGRDVSSISWGNYPKVPTPLRPRQPGDQSYIRLPPTREFYRGTTPTNPETPYVLGEFEGEISLR